MSENSTTPKSRIPGLADDGGTDWARLDAMTNDDIIAAAAKDPDSPKINPPPHPSRRRVGLHGVLRRRLRISHAEFERRYHIPADLVLAWERGKATPDPIQAAYLRLIFADPEGTAATLAQAELAAAE